MARANRDDRSIKRCECLIIDVPGDNDTYSSRVVFFLDRTYVEYCMEEDNDDRMTQAKWMLSEHNTLLISRYDSDGDGDTDIVWREAKAVTSKAVVDWLAELSLIPRRTESK